MKVVVERGSIYLGEQTWNEGDVIEVDETLAKNLGSQVSPWKEPEPVVEEPPVTEEPVKEEEPPKYTSSKRGKE